MTTTGAVGQGQPALRVPDVIEFVIEFHSTFRVGAAYPNDGVDLTYDVDEPLPPDHLKGIMRAEAAMIVSALGLSEGLLDRTFGTPGHSSAWSWFGADGPWSVPILRHRVAIHPETHAAKQDHLVAATATVADRAAFVVEHSPSVTESAGEVARQAALIRLAGRSVHHLGGWRRRGYGWVGVHVEGDSARSAVDAVEADLRTLTTAGEEL